MAKAAKFYTILYTPAAGRDLKNLKNNKAVLQSIDKSIQALRIDPRPPGVVALEGCKKYRKRDGEFRILYEVDDRKAEVVVQRVRDRKDVYRH